jgi:hypothetical protein
MQKKGGQGVKTLTAFFILLSFHSSTCILSIQANTPGIVFDPVPIS